MSLGLNVINERLRSNTVTEKVFGEKNNEYILILPLFFFFLPFLISHKMAARDMLCCQPSLFLLPPHYLRPAIILHLLCLWIEKPTLQTIMLAAVFFLQFVKISSQIKRIWAKHATAIWIYMKEKPSTPPYLGWWMYLILQTSFLVLSWPQDQN